MPEHETAPTEPTAPSYPTAPTHPTAPTYPTALGASSPDRITLLGHDLVEDVMGRVGFGELAFWLAAQRRPTPGETRVFEAVLAALADHGYTPTAIVTRLTYLSAPDSVQGALAAGLLAGGSRFLGVTEDCGRFLHDQLVAATGDAAQRSSTTGGAELPVDDESWDALALRTVTAQREAKRFVPGLGHHVHKQGDPRTPKLMALAAEEGVAGPHLALFAAIGRVHPQVLGKTLPLNGAGVCGAVLADLGLPLELLRGFALLARTAGLIGQLAEELRHPVANDIFLSVDLHNRPVDPDPYSAPSLGHPSLEGDAHG
jgi:citrate synthase